MATRSAERTRSRLGSCLPVLRNPESHATVPSLQQIESHALRWGSLGLPHGPVHATHHRGISTSLHRHFKLKVLCGIVYVTTIEFGIRVVSKLKVESSNKLMDSDPEMGEEIILLEPLIKRVRDSLKSLSLGRLSKVDSPSPVVKSFHRHFEIVCRLLSKFEKSGSSSAPADQESMEYSFIHSFLCLLSRFYELSTFFKIPSNLSVEVEECKKAFSSIRLDLIPLIDACSNYLQDNHKSELEMKIPIETIPPSEYLEGAVLKRVIYSIVKRYLVPSGFDGKEVDDKNPPILSNDPSQIGNQTLLDDPTVLGDISLFDQFLFNDEILLDDPNLLDPFVQTPPTLLPSSSSTNLSSTPLENSDVIPSSSEPPRDPLHLPHSTSFSSVALSKSNEFGNETLLDDQTALVDISQLDQFLFNDEILLDDPTQFVNQTLLDDPTVLVDLFDDQAHLDPLLQAPPTSPLPSFSATFLNPTRLKSIPSSTEPLQDPLHLPDPIPFSSLAPSTSGFSSSQCVSADVEGSKSNESDSHFTENRPAREMDAKNRARSHRPLKRGSSSFSGRKKVAPKIQKTPSRDQIAIDDSHLTPPTSLNRSFSSSGHPISTPLEFQADNPISSESGDIPLTDENLQLLKTRQKVFKSIRVQDFFDNTTAANPTCLLCNRHVRLPLEHIRLHLTTKKQTLKQLLDYCCDTERAPPIMNAHTIAKLIRKTFQKVTVCPVCFVPIGEGGNYFGEHFRQEHLKDVERSCDELDSLVKKCFVNVSIESGVNKYSCAICGTAYQWGSSGTPPSLYDNIEECLRLVPKSEKSPLVDLAAVYEWFLNESKDGKCPHCKNKIKDFGWPHFNKCQANYTCGVKVESGSIREVCPNCHIPVGCEAHSKACDKLRDVNTRFKYECYYDRLPARNKVTCSVALNGTTKCGQTCWLNGLPRHLSKAHQIEGIKDENWILCDGYCWCQWCGVRESRFQHQVK